MLVLSMVRVTIYISRVCRAKKYILCLGPCRNGRTQTPCKSFVDKVETEILRWLKTTWFQFSGHFVREFVIRPVEHS
jgi:hypothetical protein